MAAKKKEEAAAEPEPEAPSDPRAELEAGLDALDDQAAALLAMDLPPGVDAHLANIAKATGAARNATQTALGRVRE